MTRSIFRTCGLMALAAAGSAGVQAQTTLTLSSWVPPAHTLTASQAEWCEMLAAKAKGAIKCNVLPRAVSAPPGTFDAVRNGLADISFTVHGYTPGRFVTTQLAEFPFLGDSAEASSVAFNRMYDKYAAIREEHKGVKVIAVFTHGPGMVLNTKRPIARIDDLAGLKFRIGGGMINTITKQLGMNVTLKPAPESYELLSTGVMDGTLFPAESTESFKIDKIIKHATTFPGGLYNTSFVFMMNQAKYDKLSAEDKKAVDAISGETAARIYGRGWDKVDRRAFALMQVNNVVVTKADAKFVAEVKTKTKALEQNWINASKAKGLKDPAKVLAEFRAEIAKLEK